MEIDGVQIAVTRAWIEDVLSLRIHKQGNNITDLFMVTHAPTEQHEGDAFIETRFGKLRVFWRNDMPKDKLAQILHTSKFAYPRKGQSLELAKMTTNEAHTKVDKPKMASTERKARVEVSEEVEKDAAQVMDELNREGFAKKDLTNGAFDMNGDLVH